MRTLTEPPRPSSAAPAPAARTGALARSTRAALACALALATGPGCSALDPELGDQVPRDEDGAGSDVVVVFARDIRPLMERSDDDATGHGCKKCHYPSEPEHVGFDLGGLDLETLGALRKGGATSGARVVVPGEASESVLVQKLEGTYGFGARMPRDGPPYWTAAEIGLVRSWIAAGAVGEDDE